MFQRKGEGREGFAAARGNCERIKPLWCMSTLFHAGPQYFVPLLRDRGSGRAVKVAFGLCPDFSSRAESGSPIPRGAALPSMKVSVSMKSASTRLE